VLPSFETVARKRAIADALRRRSSSSNQERRPKAAYAPQADDGVCSRRPPWKGAMDSVRGEFLASRIPGVEFQIIFIAALTTNH
jgi:hypothetical protein